VEDGGTEAEPPKLNPPAGAAPKPDALGTAPKLGGADGAGEPKGAAAPEAPPNWKTAPEDDCEDAGVDEDAPKAKMPL
jgi:hypothetical protein